MVYSSLAARLASGLREEDRLKHVREYQRQLVEKHEQRMKALADARAKIENRQTDTGVQSVSQSLLSTSGQGVNDPATLVPYTLRTSALPAESFSSSALPRSSVVSGGEDVSSTTREPILAGSFGMSVSGDSRWQQLNQEKKSGVPVTAAADWGDRGATAASKLDSVRKSLPFDNPDETLHREDADGEAGDTDGVSLADDSHISSSTDRGSPALGSRSYKSSGSGHSGSLGSGMSGGSISGSSLVARAEEKRISFEQRQRELQDQLAEIQRQKDLLLQRYHGNQERVSAQEESVRSKLRAAQAATSSVAGGSALTRPQPTGSARAFGLTSDLPSSGPSMELEEGSLSSERLSQRPGVRSWAMELEEFSATQDKSGDRSSRTPGDLTLEEISITSEREWSGGRRARDGDRSGETEQRPTSSLSSLQEASFGNGMNSARSLSVEELSPFSLTAVSNENLAPALTSYTGAQSQSSQDRVASARSSTEVENMLQELARAGSVGAGISWSSLFTSGQSVLQEDPNQNGGSADDFTRLPPPPTRQPIPVTQYEPHELSTILEVDTPQTGSKTITATGGSPSTTRQAPGAAVGSETAGGSEKTGARRFIDFGKHGTTTAPDDDKASESKFSASGSSASSDVRSVIEVIRPGMLRTSATRAGVEMERADPGLNEKGDFRIATSGFVSLQQQQGQSVSNPKPNLSLLSSFQPRDTEALPGSHDTSQASSARGFHPLNLTLDSLTSRSLSMEDSRARRFLDFSDTESAAVGTTTAGAGSEGGGGRGQPADEVLRQARKFNQDLMAAIQQQAADVFDQSSQSTLSVSHSAADASHGSGLSQR
nr:hypothetical protein BaRGS_023424 [Batillaria attramentaria]